jgi:hypothetical protein
VKGEERRDMAMGCMIQQAQSTLSVTSSHVVGSPFVHQITNSSDERRRNAEAIHLRREVGSLSTGQVPRISHGRRRSDRARNYYTVACEQLQLRLALPLVR